VVDIVSSFFTTFDKREKATSIVGTLEEFRMFIAPFGRSDVLPII
jgi:hypothetical protein